MNNYVSSKRNYTEQQLITALKCVYYVANNTREFNKSESFVFDDVECTLNDSLKTVESFILNLIEEECY